MEKSLHFEYLIKCARDSKYESRSNIDIENLVKVDLRLQVDKGNISFHVLCYKVLCRHSCR